jgi:hypothetical protein
MTFTPYGWSNAEPWPYRRDVWTRRNPYPTPLWVRLLERRTPFWMMDDSPGFYRRGSPVQDRYRAWRQATG